MSGFCGGLSPNTRTYVAILLTAPAVTVYLRAMSRRNILPAALLLGLSGAISFTTAQAQIADSENEAVKRVVEIFLYAEEPAQVRRVVDPQAKIFSTTDGRLQVTPLSTPARKLPKDAKTRVPRQRITNIDVSGNGAVVTVVTDRFAADEPATQPKHTQYISLLRINNDWRIVSILMPPFRLEAVE